MVIIALCNGNFNVTETLSNVKHNWTLNINRCFPSLSADPRLLGALRKTVSGGDGWDVFVRVSLRLESRSQKALEKQYLFRGSYKLSFFVFF